LPEVEKAWKQSKNKDAQFFGINVDGRGDVDGSVKKFGLTFPNMVDNAGVSQDYGIRALPTMVVIDKEGIVRKIQIGYDSSAVRGLPKLLDLYTK
jgi:peroxiredoxin